jgi:hypothetical protein
MRSASTPQLSQGGRVVGSSGGVAQPVAEVSAVDEGGSGGGRGHAGVFDFMAAAAEASGGGVGGGIGGGTGVSPPAKRASSAPVVFSFADAVAAAEDEELGEEASAALDALWSGGFE